VTVVRCTTRNLAGLETSEEARVFIRNWASKISPTTLNLSSNGGANSVTLNIEGLNVGLLVDGGVLLSVGSRLVQTQLQSVGGPAGHPKLVLKVDRQQLISAIGDVSPERRKGVEHLVEVVLRSGSRDFGSELLSVK